MRSACLILAVALVVGTVSHSAHAQGTMGQFPDPLSTPELTRLLERYLTIHDRQWLEIEAAHDDYRREFQALRDGDMQRVLDLSSGMQMRMPTKAAVEDLMRRSDRVVTRIRALDNRLFDQIAIGLDEDQFAALSRVRQARDRQRHLSSQAMMWSGGNRPVDLSQIVLEMDLSPEQRARADATLVSYEPTLTRATAALYDAGNKLLVKLIDAFEAAGFADLSQEEMMEDPARMQEMMEVMQAAWASVTADTNKAVIDIRELNHRTRTTLAQALGPERGREFRDAFLARAYSGFASRPAEGRSVFDQAMRVSELTDDQRAAIEAMFETYLTSDDRLVEELIKISDRQADEMNPMDFGGSGGYAEFGEKLSELSQRRATLVNEFRESVKGLVGTEVLRASAQAQYEAQQAMPAAQSAMEALAAAEAETWGHSDADDGFGHSGDPYIRGPISVRDVATWASRMNLDPGRRAVFDALHSDYLADWDATVRPAIEAIHSAMARLGEGPDGSRTVVPNLSAASSARAAAQTAVEAADRGFLRTASDAIATDDEVGLFELFELERALTGTPSWTFGGGENEEATINLVRVFLSAPESEEMLPIIEHVLLAHADELRRTSAEVAASSRQGQRAMEEVSAKFHEVAGDAERTMEISMEMQRLMSENSRRTAAASSARREVNRQILTELETAMTPEHFQVLQRAYRRAAWPSVYSGPGSPMPLIEAALKLSDLSDEQRESLEALRESTDAAYEEASLRILDGMGDSMAIDYTSPEDVRKWMEDQQRSQRLRFDRNEIASRAIRRVRMTLNEEQRGRLPGLESFDEVLRQSDPYQWWEN